jgi:hypothetical protein
MEKQNITLSIRKDILQKVKLIAVQRQISVSALMTELLQELVGQEDAYAQAMRRHLALLEHSYDLGTGGQITGSRDELHERD